LLVIAVMLQRDIIAIARITATAKCNNIQ
jgi:hypothetical protein